MGCQNHTLLTVQVGISDVADIEEYLSYLRGYLYSPTQSSANTYIQMGSRHLLQAERNERQKYETAFMVSNSMRLYMIALSNPIVHFFYYNNVLVSISFYRLIVCLLKCQSGNAHRRD